MIKLPSKTVLSTLSIVTVRSAGVGARSLSLLTLAATMPAERFGQYATAFVMSELARCATDFGLDQVVLRQAEGLGFDQQRSLIRSVVGVRGLHAVISAIFVITILAINFPIDILICAAGLQFVSQSFLQLSLNWRQVNNEMQRLAPALLLFYCSIIALAVGAYLIKSLGVLPLPLLLIGEGILAVILLYPALPPRRVALFRSYLALVRKALPMAGIMVLGFVNTRTDALLARWILGPDDGGRYLYLARWVDFAPMLTVGVLLPMVGKMKDFRFQRYRKYLAAMLVIVLAIPFVLIEIAALLNPPYADHLSLRMTLATAAACRVGLAVTTTALLAQWRDGLLAKIAVLSTLMVPVLVIGMGSLFAALGVALAVLIAEAGNLLLQTFLLLRSRTSVTSPKSLSQHD